VTALGESEPPCSAQTGNTFAFKRQLQKASSCLARSAPKHSVPLQHPQRAGEVEETDLGPVVHHALERHKISKNQAPNICPFLSGVRTEACACLWHKSRRTGGIWQSLVPLCEHVWDLSVLCQQCPKLLPCLPHRSPCCGQPLQAVRAQAAREPSCMGQEGEGLLAARSPLSRAKASSWGTHRGLGLLVRHNQGRFYQSEAVAYTEE